jgi:hypothetical protein
MRLRVNLRPSDPLIINPRPDRSPAHFDVLDLKGRRLGTYRLATDRLPTWITDPVARITVSLSWSTLIRRTRQIAPIAKPAPPPRWCEVSVPAFRARDSVRYWSVSEGVQGLRTRLRALDRRMIDITQETLIPLREAPRRLPPRTSGKRVHISACYRWISRAVRGVHLEAIRIGGTTYTSAEALQRFADCLGSPGEQQMTPKPTPSRARQKQIDRASKRLREALGLNQSDHPPVPSNNSVPGEDKPVPSQ